MNLNKLLSGLVAASALALLPTTLMAQTTLEIGQTFLQENAKKEGVHQTSSGLQYKVIKEGTGTAPKATSTVLVNYRGTHIDGTVFDSSEKPIKFPLNGVIAGWTEGVQLMKEGAKYQLFVPAKLAYGQHGTPGGPIQPDETLVFEVELLKVF